MMEVKMDVKMEATEESGDVVQAALHAVLQGSPPSMPSGSSGSGDAGAAAPDGTRAFLTRTPLATGPTFSNVQTPSRRTRCACTLAGG